MANEANTNKQMRTLKVEDNFYNFDATWLGGLTADQYALKTDIAAGLHYKGTVAGGDTSPGAFTSAAEAGDIYVVSTPGYVNGEYCDNGDLWLCNTKCNAATSSNYLDVINSWDIIQGNIKMTDLENRFSEADHTHEVSGDTGITSITPTGTVSITAENVSTGATFTPSVSIGDAGIHEHTVTVKHTPTGTVTITKADTGTVNYTPEGKITDNTHKHSVTVSHTPAGTVAVTAGHGTETASDTYKPRGTINSVADHTHDGSVSISYTPAGTITVNGAVGDADAATTINPTGTISGGSHTHAYSSSYKPDGTVSGGKHTHTVTVDLVPDGTAGYDPATYTLNLVPTVTCSEVTPSSYSFSGTPATISGTTDSSTPSHTFTGTAIKLTGSFSGTAATIAGDFTTSKAGGHGHTFTGTDVKLAGSFSGTEFSSTVYTTEDTHSHTFNGTGAVLAAAFSGNEVGTTYTTSEAGSHNHTATGTGVKLSATFSGISAEHSHSISFTTSAANK